jgi:hypothetical protein
LNFRVLNRSDDRKHMGQIASLTAQPNWAEFPEDTFRNIRM